MASDDTTRAPRRPDWWFHWLQRVLPLDWHSYPEARCRHPYCVLANRHAPTRRWVEESRHGV